MLEETKVCPKCGGCCNPEDDNKPSEEGETKEKKSQTMGSNEEFHFAILLALVPAMAMSLFNLIGLI